MPVRGNFVIAFPLSSKVPLMQQQKWQSFLVIDAFVGRQYKRRLNK
jgi:hypothetical protein